MVSLGNTVHIIQQQQNVYLRVFEVVYDLQVVQFIDFSGVKFINNIISNKININLFWTKH